MSKKEKKYTVLILLLLIILSSIWLIPKGLTFSHDIEFHYTRVNSLVSTIRNGDFLALIHDMLGGYGYANGLFYSNFFFYIPAFLLLIGLPIMLSYKIFILLINIATVLSSYFCFSKIIKNKRVVLFTTTIYTLSIYRIMCIFVRGAIGELLAMIFIPIIILGLYEIIYGDYKKWYLFTIGFVFILLSHLISTVLMAFVSVIIILINYRRFFEEKNRIKYLLLSGLVGVLLGGFFLFPIIEQYFDKSIRIFVVGSAGTNLYDMALDLFMFIQPVPFSKDTVFLHNIGYAGYLLLFIPFIFKDKKSSKDSLKSFGKILYIISIILVIFTTKLFPWGIFEKYLSFIQFPWRLLIIVSAFLAFSTGIYLDSLLKNKNNCKNKNLNIFLQIVLFVTFLCITAYSLVYSFIVPRYDKFNEIIGLGEYLPAEINVYDAILYDYNYVTNNDELVYNINRKGKNIYIEYKNNNKDNTYLELPVFNYKGYVSDGAKIESGFKHRMRLLLDKKEGRVHIYYGMTKVQKFSYVLSGISCILFVAYLIVIKINKNDNK